MPYKYEKEKLRIDSKDDKRRKLTDEQKKEIAEKYATGLFSQRQLAASYNVSRRLISFIIDPEKAKRVVELHDSSKYYDKEKHKEYMRTHRKHKQELSKQNKLVRRLDVPSTSETSKAI